MRGMRYLMDRPGCEFPDLIKIIKHRRLRVEHRNGWTKPKRSNDRRSSSDKTGHWTRMRQRQEILKRYGPLCHICLARGVTDQRALIDLTLPWPHPRCFTRDHYVPRSKGGSDTIENLRPAHHVCNRDRGNGPVAETDALTDDEMTSERIVA